METKDKKKAQNTETQNRKNKNADPIPGSEERNSSNKAASSGAANRATPEQAAQQDEFETEAGEELNSGDNSDQKSSRGTSKSEQPTRQRGKSTTQPGTPRGSADSQREDIDQNRDNEGNRSAREQRNRASGQAEPLADYNYLNRRDWPGTGQSDRWRDKMIFESDQDYNAGMSPHGMNTPMGMNIGRNRGNENRFDEGERTNLGYERRMREERRNEERRSQGQRNEGRDYSDYRNTGRYEGPGADTGSSPYRGYDRDYGSRPTDFRNRGNYESSQYGDDRSFTREESDFRNRSFGSDHTSDDERQPNYSDVRHGGYMSTSNRNNYDPGDDNSYGMSRARDYERFNRGSHPGRGSESERDFGREQQNFGNRSGEYENRGRYSERNRDRDTGRSEDWNRQGNRERGWEQPENRERESYQGYGETSYSDRYDKDISRRGEDRENRKRGGMDRRGHEARSSADRERYNDPYRDYDWSSRRGNW